MVVFARIHDAVRIQRIPDLPYDRHGVRAEFIDLGLTLANPQNVLDTELDAAP